MGLSLGGAELCVQLATKENRIMLPQRRLKFDSRFNEREIEQLGTGSPQLNLD